uniref:Brefeldin a-inhibited guanine nucleotide-exchange protein 2-like n=1 Tax=Tetraselmis sp. GSL018 TaxID=582737 RepID=A0A061RZG9_9CHLO|mmetsp:Transcript_35654/g.84489  ORF Transcript_35654/g.84489 Transcript_35654/m.84489 type:complete len:1770 (+) Transcript_35654:718-6027(+)
MPAPSGGHPASACLLLAARQQLNLRTASPTQVSLFTESPRSNVSQGPAHAPCTCLLTPLSTPRWRPLSFSPLQVVRCCYNIYLTSRSEVNQATAKASLTQMVNIVFQRMEANSVVVPMQPIMVSDILGLGPSMSSDTASVASVVQTFLNRVVDDFTAPPNPDALREGLDAAFASDRGGMDGDEMADNQDGGSSQGQASPHPPAPPATPEQQPRNPSDTHWRTPQEGASASKFTSSMSVGSANREQSHCSLAAKALQQSGPSSAVLLRDAFLVFRSLCKLSSKTSDSSPGMDAMAIRGKLLSLELIKILLENSGPVFARSERFISAVKQHLCLSLLKNSASPVPQAQRLSCSILLTLVRKFRQTLKAEVNEFFPMILLKALEPVGGTMATVNTSPSANIPFSPAHVTVILRCLKEQCSDGQLLVDLFVNYDCDLEGSNIFERMVIGLVRIAQGHGTLPDTASKQVQEQEAQHQLMSTECLVAILKSLVAWYLNGTAQAQEDGEQAEAVDAAEQSQGKKAKDRSVGNLSSASDAETDAGDKATREWEMVESRKAYKMGFQEGIALFNKKPQDGIRFMQEQGMLGKEPHEIAAFLGKTSGLNRTKIGEYLGEREDTALKVMHAYIDAMDFTDMDIDEAIRKFLADFRLPGEAQKIDRLMEKFAERYFMDNPSSLFKSADVAYVLAFSVIMLNTDAHNPMVKVKMTKEGFISNNRGINDGHDLPQEYLSDLYDRIVSNEIKMKDMELLEGRQAAPKEAPSAAKGWVDTIMGLIGRRNADLNEPSDDALHRTLDYLKEKAKGATFFTATDGETVRPMVEVAWAPMLGAFSVLYEDSMSPELCQACLEGFYYAVTLTSTLGMTMLRDTYVTSLSRFTSLHNPGNMTLKSAEALRTLIAAAERNSNNFQGAWPEVLRCVSRFDLLMQQHSGAPADSVLFAQNTAEPEKPEKQKRKFFRRSRHSRINDAGPMSDIDSTMREEREVITMAGETAAVGLQDVGTPRKPVHRPLAVGELMPAPPPGVLNAIDTEDLNRLFVCSDRLNSTAIVEFVTALCSVSLEELANTSHPRVYGLTKIVEIAHFNMTRIRLVWNRIWAVLSDYFITVGCHQNLSVAIFAVDSLRQLAMKFLERDELANYTFQNDFLRPFVVVMRQSSSLEIRELIIRCVSQMVLARVANVKSGWKSMFMVFTTAAQDEAQQIVRLSFETIEKIVREHFEHITETEVATFTDCVNCLIAFTNNSHSLDVALNAIAFLRFCAMKLADGTIGSVDELPEEALKEGEHHIGKASGIRCIDGRVSDGSDGRGDEAALARAEADTDGNILIVRGASGRLHFTDKDEHMYFWFPLLAGLSELTFDPRPDIRYSALEVLFDILRYHGKCFSASFWARVFDSVIFPIFDHVRAEVTDTTTFSDDRRRADEDKWLYETCTKCLQHLIDLFCHFFSVAQVMLPRLLELLKGFIRRSHQSLAAVGVAALVRLISEAGPIMSDAHWLQTMQAVRSSAVDTMPQVADLVWVSHASSGDGDGSAEIEAIGDAFLLRDWSLSEGVGSRRLSEMHCRAAVQLLLVQAAGEVYARHCRCLPSAAVVVILDVLRGISSHARAVDADLELRRALANKQAADGVAEHRCLPDPPLMKLESEASHSYLSVLLHISMAPGASEAKSAACIEERLVELCVANLQRYEEVGPFSDPGNAAALEDALAPSNISMTTSTAEHSVRAPLVVATLRALSSLGDEEFRRHLHEFFPLLTRLISCQHAPVEVQRALSTLFQKRIGPLLQ